MRFCSASRARTTGRNKPGRPPRPGSASPFRRPTAGCLAALDAGRAVPGCRGSRIGSAVDLGPGCLVAPAWELECPSGEYLVGGAHVRNERAVVVFGVAVAVLDDVAAVGLP